MVYAPPMTLLLLPEELIAEVVMGFLGEADAKSFALASKAGHFIAQSRLAALAVTQRHVRKRRMLARHCVQCFDLVWDEGFDDVVPVGICCKLEGDSKCEDFYVEYKWTENECFSTCPVRDQLLMHMATEHPTRFEAIIKEQDQINQICGKAIIDRVHGKGSEADFIDYPIFVQDETDPEGLRLIQVA